ncbi:ABC transporter ATP-binding protein [Actinosynnema sp. CA-248983]
MNPLLEVRDLRITTAGVDLVRGLSFDVSAGELLAVVGESGAGKSVTARALVGLPPAGMRVSGQIRFDGEDLVTYRRLWGRRIAFVPQDALSVLSPVHTIGDQLALAVRSVRGVGRKEALALAVAALDRVGIPDAARRARAYPHEFSGGMRQRAVIAMATVNDPDLVVADEPTTALDPTVQARVLDLLDSFRERAGTAVVLVTHDLPVAAARADRVLVMYAGRHVESGPARRVLREPRAPYTAGLVASLPSRHSTSRYLPVLPGTPAAPDSPAPGCAFAPRCPAATDVCTRNEPERVEWRDGHRVSCHRLAELPQRTADLFEGITA